MGFRLWAFAGSYAPYLLGCASLFVVSAMSEPPVPTALVFRWSDKALHAVAYAVLACLALRGARRRGDGAALARRLALAPSWGPVVVAVLLATGYGVLDEVHQAFVPKRNADALDVVADLVGACIGATFAQRVRRKPAAENPKPLQAS